VLAGWTGPEVDLNAVFPRGRTMSPKVRAFVDFLVERLSSNADYMMAQCPSMCSAGKATAAEAAAPASADATEEATEREGKRILEQMLS